MRGSVRDTGLNVELSNTGIQPDIGVESEGSLPERDRGVLEEYAGLIVECVVAILTVTSLKHSTVAVLNP